MNGRVHHRLYRNNGGRGFVDVTKQTGEEWMAAPGVFASFSADFNHDGYLDLYLGRRLNQDLMAFGQPDGMFQTHGGDIGIETKNVPDISENTMGPGGGDINTDGYIDVLIRTGIHRTLWMTSYSVAAEIPPAPSGWPSTAAAVF